jgi:hypothetical protein
MQIVEAPVLNNPTMTQLRDLIDGKAPEPEAQAEETSDTAAEVEKDPEAKSEPEPEAAKAAEDPEPEEGEEPLPKGVQKQIEREAKKQAEWQARIEAAKAKTKQAKDEAERLERETGTEPEKPTRKGEGEPTFPDIDNFQGTVAEYKAAVAKYHTDYAAWLKTHTAEAVRAELERERQQKAADERWNAAVTEHGADFEAKAKTIADTAPKEMQIAISALENWSKVAVHLADNPGELQALAEQFKSNPYAAVAALGKLEAKVTAPPPVVPKAKEKEPPPPLKKAPAAADAAADSSFDWSKATMAQKAAYLKRTGAL